MIDKTTHLEMIARLNGYETTKQYIDSVQCLDLTQDQTQDQTQDTHLKN